MTAKLMNENGSIFITDNVIATIAGISAMETYGIVGMATKNATDGLLEILKLENLTKGIKVTAFEEGVKIEIYVVTQYGINISVVAENLKEKVRFNVEKYTGLNVLDLTLNVQGIRTGK